MGTNDHRLNKLEERMFGEGYRRWRNDPLWGKSTEEIEEEFADLPRQVAHRARELAAMRERGESSVANEAVILAEGNATDMLAVLISYGDRENIPKELAEAANEISREARAAPDALPPEMSAKLGTFVIDTDRRAREIFAAEVEQ